MREYNNDQVIVEVIDQGIGIS